MLQLLDLPPKIVGAVIDAAVLDLGLKASVSLRLVNRFFNEAVFSAYENQLIFHNTVDYTCTSFKARHNHEYGAALTPFIARFLSRKPYCNEAEFWKIYRAEWKRDCEPAKPQAKRQLNISIFLHTLLDELHVPQENRYEPLKLLCEQIDDVRAFESDVGASYNSSKPGVVMEILHGFAPLHFQNFQPNLLSAAILLKAPDVYEPLLGAAASAPSHGIDSKFGTPVYAAIKSGQHELTRRLLRLFDRKKEPVRFPPLVAAVKTGDLSMVQIVLEEEKRDITSEDEISSEMHNLSVDSSPGEFQAPEEREVSMGIVTGSRLGHNEIVKYILEFVEKQRKLTETELAGAMYYASLYGYTDLMQMLVGHGASLEMVREQPANSPTPLELATWSGSEDTIKWLTSRLNPPYGIMNALAGVLSNNPAALKLVLDKETQESISEEYWKAFVWNAIRLRCYKTVAYLLEEIKIIDPVAGFQKDPTGYGTLMEVCASEGHLEAFEILFRIGMPFNRELKQGIEGVNMHWTPIVFAQSANTDGSKEIVKRLEELGVEKVDLAVVAKKHNELVSQEGFTAGSEKLEYKMPVANAIGNQNAHLAKREKSAVIVNYKSEHRSM